MPEDDRSSADERSSASSFDYAVVRIVPRVERGEYINAGVILFSRTLKFLEAKVQLHEGKLKAFSSEPDLAEIYDHLKLIPKICSGSPEGGPIAQLPQHERWHWLVSPRSTVIQISDVHSGVTNDPAKELGKLFTMLVE